ncbi:MAG: helix-turn-helix transcriptional regulator [Treponema sp.]|nr:helix-turn-helix transcriptional regulator [Treponema sp.]
MNTDTLRSILAHNIKRRRKELHLTQVKLAEYAGISEPYMNDIERCQTWVSDKTLTNLARALHIEVYKLLIPHKESRTESGEADISGRAYTLMSAKKKDLHKYIDQTFELAIREIIPLYSSSQGNGIPHADSAEDQSTD